MIDLTFVQEDYSTAGTAPGNDALHRYVRALLARQQALDLLESIHQQINQIWSTMRRFLERPARAAQSPKAAEVKNTYRTLEKRREECIAALQDAECRANAAWQSLLTPNSLAPSRKSTGSPLPSRNKTNNRLARRKLEKACSGSC